MDTGGIFSPLDVVITSEGDERLGERVGWYEQAVHRKGGRKKMEERWREKIPVHSCTYTSVSDLLREPVNALPSPLILPVMYKNPSYNKMMTHYVKINILGTGIQQSILRER